MSNHLIIMLSATGYEGEINPSFLPSDELWFLMQPLLPLSKRVRRGWGCPPQSGHNMLVSLFYVQRTGIQCKALPCPSGDSSTVHDRFQQWERAGVFRKLWESGILQLHIEGNLTGLFKV